MAHRDVDTEANVWHDIEGPSWQRAQWEVLKCRHIEGEDLLAVPARGLGELRWMWFRLSAATVQQSGFSDIAQQWVQDLILPAGPPGDSVIACSLPPGIAELVVRGRMTSIGMSLCRRYPGDLEVLNPLADLRAALQIPRAPPDLALDRDTFAHLNSALEDWRPVLVRGAASPEEADDMVDDLRRFQAWALQCAFSLSPRSMLLHRISLVGKFAKRALVGNRHRREKLAQGGQVAEMHGRYTNWFVLHATLLSHCLMQDADMGRVLELAVRCAFPPELAKELVKLMEDMPVPHPSSLTRWRLQVDVAFMMWQRKLHATWMDRDGLAAQFPLYVLSDYSPQGGRDWLLTETHHLCGHDKDLLATYDRACELVRRLVEFRKQGVSNVSADVELELHGLASDIRSQLGVEVSPPCRPWF